MLVFLLGILAVCMSAVFFQPADLFSANDWNQNHAVAYTNDVLSAREGITVSPVPRGTNAVVRKSLAISHIEWIEEDGLLTDVVEMLLEEGTICAKRRGGHVWMEIGSTYVVPYSNQFPGTLKCLICNRHNNKKDENWK